MNFSQCWKLKVCSGVECSGSHYKDGCYEVFLKDLLKIALQFSRQALVRGFVEKYFSYHLY